jgi:hypothetical protein
MSSTVKPKRGRKTKNVVPPLENQPLENPPLEKVEPNQDCESVKENAIQMVFQEGLGEAIQNQQDEAVKDMEENSLELVFQENPVFSYIDEQNSVIVEVEADIPKKRGRKPKGGKIIQQVVSNNDNKESKPNVILHLKCSLKDIQPSASSKTNIQCFNFESNKSDLSYEIIGNSENTFVNHTNNVLELKPSYDDDEQEEECKKDNELKDVWKKLKSLEHNLHVNNISDKKSACFWCTCEFDNPPIYIPKSYMKETYNVYGCFCTPECAVGHLMEENIDSSAKFERYHMINHIYTKVYNYNKNIKPAPNPYYMLDKYYGNLSIQEYRALLRSERLFLIVDKPLTRILPELHEDNDDFIINNKIIPSNTYQIKKKVPRKQQSKNTILNEKFGF